MKSRKGKKAIWILGIIDALVLIFIISFVIIKMGQKKESTDTTVSASGKETLSISIDDNTKDDDNTVAISDEDDDDSLDDELISADDERKGDTSIYNTPFEDGYEFPDLSDYDFIFVGDSIFDMYNSPTSMPRQLEVYTNSRVYNLAKNMSCAGDSSNNQVSLSYLTSSFLAKTDIGEGKIGSFNTDIVRFAKDKHKKKKMVIVFDHCLNDYTFSSPMSNPNDAYDINSYEGALRSNISKIKAEYPEATLVFMEPYYIGISNCGYDLNTYGYNLDDYITTLERVAGEYQMMLFKLRSYDFFKEYRDGYLLEDGIHPNDMCAKTMARLFCDFVLNNIR